MNIEEAVRTIRELIDGVKEYGYDYTVEEAVVINKSEYTAIETLLTAYENLKSYNKGTKEALRVAEDLEHQANKEAGDWEARCFELEAELEKEKEKNKLLEENYSSAHEDINWFCENYIHKDKVIAKVIEIKDRPVKDEFITATQGKLNTIIDIESLLDEEE